MTAHFTLERDGMLELHAPAGSEIFVRILRPKTALHPESCDYRPRDADAIAIEESTR
jgi:hypothetical protein